MRNVFFDTETTGLNPGQIAQISYIIEEDNKFIKAQNLYFKVDTMEEGAQKVHGMSKEFLELASEGKTFADQKDLLLQDFNNSTLVAHNVAFDEKFMSAEFWRLGIMFRPIGRQCTMQFFKNQLKIPARTAKYGPYKNPTLSEVLRYYKIEEHQVMELSKKLFPYNANAQTFHDARFDTTAMFVAVNIFREIQSGRTEWRKIYCLE